MLSLRLKFVMHMVGQDGHPYTEIFASLVCKHGQQTLISNFRLEKIFQNMCSSDLPGRLQAWATLQNAAICQMSACFQILVV